MEIVKNLVYGLIVVGILCCFCVLVYFTIEVPVLRITAGILMGLGFVYLTGDIIRNGIN